jgi:hypothetical protein
MKTLLLLLLTFSALFSAPAYSHLREFKNADGSTFYAIAKGDHHLHWIETEGGDILKYNTQTRDFEYAKLEGKKLLPSGEKYELHKVQTSTNKVTLDTIKSVQKEFTPSYR